MRSPNRQSPIGKNMKIIFFVIVFLLLAGCIHMIVPAIFSEVYKIDQMKKLEKRIEDLEGDKK